MYTTDKRTREGLRTAFARRGARCGCGELRHVPRGEGAAVVGLSWPGKDAGNAPGEMVYEGLVRVAWSGYGM